VVCGLPEIEFEYMLIVAGTGIGRVNVEEKAGKNLGNGKTKLLGLEYSKK
jgi:hypothetical protein